MGLLIIELDFDSEIPIYLQVKNEIIEGIATEKLKPGTTLPSIRSLAADIGVNMHTIRKSYQLLKQDGFVSISRKDGVVVKSKLPKVDEEFIAKLQEEIRPLIAEAICRGLERAEWKEICSKLFKEIRGQ